MNRSVFASSDDFVAYCHRKTFGAEQVIIESCALVYSRSLPWPSSSSRDEQDARVDTSRLPEHDDGIRVLPIWGRRRVSEGCARKANEFQQVPAKTRKRYGVPTRYKEGQIQRALNRPARVNRGERSFPSGGGVRGVGKRTSLSS